MNLNFEYFIGQNTFKRIGLKDAYQEPSPDKSHLFKIYAQNCYSEYTYSHKCTFRIWKKSFKNRWCVTFVRCLWKLWSHELTQVGQMSHIVWPRRFLLNKFVLILLMKVRTSLWYNICRHENLHSISTQGNATFYSLRSFLCNLCNNLLYWQGLENSK